MAGHILLAEDDRALSALMQDFFQAAGVAVTPAYDGEQALTLAQVRSFDLLVLDVMMPQLNGLEVCQAVRRESDVPVIFVTALGQEGDTLAGFRAGADDYVTKPFSFPVLVAKAQALMRRARGLRLGETELGYGSILLDTATHAVTVDGAPMIMSQSRFPFPCWSPRRRRSCAGRAACGWEKPSWATEAFCWTP